jgi:hypothetical protein
VSYLTVQTAPPRYVQVVLGLQEGMK